LPACAFGPFFCCAATSRIFAAWASALFSISTWGVGGGLVPHPASGAVKPMATANVNRDISHEFKELIIEQVLMQDD
jgi:hypothetical protein